VEICRSLSPNDKEFIAEDVKETMARGPPQAIIGGNAGPVPFAVGPARRDVGDYQLH
jgi:hypothetical protein